MVVKEVELIYQRKVMEYEDLKFTVLKHFLHKTCKIQENISQNHSKHGEL